MKLIKIAAFKNKDIFNKKACILDVNRLLNFLKNYY